jgi:hypothetical protein
MRMIGLYICDDLTGVCPTRTYVYAPLYTLFHVGSGIGYEWWMSGHYLFLSFLSSIAGVTIVSRYSVVFIIDPRVYN